jgi:diguanylate cyclase (GGDEF)-like protein
VLIEHGRQRWLGLSSGIMELPAQRWFFHASNGHNQPMTKPCYCRLAVFFLMVCLQQTSLAAKAIQVGIYQNEPKIFIDEQGAPAGFFVEVLEAIAVREGWHMEYVPCVWQQCLQMLERGDIDIMPDVADTPRREARFAFGREAVLSSWSVVYKRPGSTIHSILDLDGRKVAVLANSIQARVLRERSREFDISPQFLEADSFAAAFGLLQRGQADFVLANRFYGAAHMARYGAEESNILLHPSALKFAFPKQRHAALQAAIDQDLRALKDDKQSVYYQSQTRWLSRLDKQRIPSWVKGAVVATGIAVLGLLGLIALLRRMVSLQTAQIDREKQHYFHLSHHDPLTDLPNRLYFFDRLEQAMKKADQCQGSLHVFFVDLNQFKHINESVGHTVGDSILRTVAGRLRDAVGSGNLIAHLGGDEFAVLVEARARPFDAADMAARLIATLDAPLAEAGQQFYLSMSIGISLYPQDGDNAQEVIKNADTALFHAKNKGRKCFEFYRTQMSAEVMRRVALESELKEALAHQQFVLYYQPQLDLASGDVLGMEALVRWLHPEQGLVGPGHFIAVAEEAGMISDLGEWVLRTACEQMVAWRQAGIDLQHIAVNVSPNQFADESFYDRVTRIITETGCRPEWVEIEITESSILDNKPENLGMLEKLRGLGFGVVIDDFGTGHSSLSRLKHLPVTKLKIDISFVRGLPDDTSDQAIVHAIIALGEGLGLKVLAEGVEREEQRDFLCEAGCDEGQGFLYSPAVAAEEIASMLAISA